RTPGERRPDQVREPLENVDPYRAVAADAITDDTVKRFGQLLVDRNRGATVGGETGQGIDSLEFGIRVLDGPQLRGKYPRGGLEQRRHVHVVSAEAHAVFAQRGARRLVQRLDFLGDLLAL